MVLYGMNAVGNLPPKKVFWRGDRRDSESTIRPERYIGLDWQSHYHPGMVTG